MQNYAPNVVEQSIENLSNSTFYGDEIDLIVVKDDLSYRFKFEFEFSWELIATDVDGDSTSCSLSDFALLTNEPVKSMNFPTTIVSQWETLTNSIAAFEYQLDDYKVNFTFLYSFDLFCEFRSTAMQQQLPVRLNVLALMTMTRQLHLPKSLAPFWATF